MSGITTICFNNSLHNILFLSLGIFHHLRIYVCASNSSYVPLDNIALNCGASASESTPSYSGRNWTGEIGSHFVPSTGYGKSMKAKASVMYPAVPEVPYMTARIFRSPFTYTFNVTPGPKFVRLYFYPVSYLGLTASKAFLSVTAGNYTLLRNFSASLTADYFNLPSMVREFTIYVHEPKLDITFIPSSNNVSDDTYAFVNGIEVVSMPTTLYIRGGDVPLPLVGQRSLFYIDNTFALEMVYRINVGGHSISPKHDTGLFRTWMADESYIFGAAFGMETNDYVISIGYPPTTPAYTAPESVYRTARSMGPYNNVNLNYNLSWFFPIDSGFRYLVRLHFCEVDPEKTQINQRVFKIFINNQTADNQADVISWSGGYGVPVYKDYVVMIPEASPVKQDLWLELYPSKESQPMHYDAILNGVEIFKLCNNDGNLAGLNPPKIESKVGPSVPVKQSSRSLSIIIIIIIGCVLGGVAIIFFLRLLVSQLKITHFARDIGLEGYSEKVINNVKGAGENFSRIGMIIENIRHLVLSFRGYSFARIT